VEDADLGIRFDAVRRVLEQLRSSTGWLSSECGTRVTNATHPASGATDWRDDAVHMFSTRWDYEIAGLSELVLTFVKSVEDSLRALEQTDTFVAGS
jgi:hypothetical protein